MNGQQTWEIVYPMWKLYVDKLDVRVKRRSPIIKVKLRRSVIPNENHRFDWLPQSESNKMIHRYKKEDAKRVSPNVTPGMCHSIQLFREVGNDEEKLAIVWIAIFIQNIKCTLKNTKYKNKEIIDQLIKMIDVKEKDFGIEPYQDLMIKTSPIYLFSPLFIENIEFHSLEMIIELIVLNAAYIVSRYVMIEYVPMKEKLIENGDFIQSIADYWQTLGKLEETSVDYSCATTRCWGCGLRKKIYPTYIVPKKLNGTYTADNLIMLCNDCKKNAPQFYNKEAIWEWLDGHKVKFFDYYQLEHSAQEYEIMYHRDIKDDFSQLYQLYQDPIKFDRTYKKILSRKKRLVKRTGVDEISPATWAVIQYETFYELTRKINYHRHRFASKINYNDFKGEYYIELPEEIMERYNNRQIKAQVTTNNGSYIGKVSVDNGQCYFCFTSQNPISLDHNQVMYIEEVIYIPRAKKQKNK